MNATANPTGLRVGLEGRLNGIHFRVAGRVVLGVEEDGETYYWQEFNLIEDSGREATLVYEETEEGPEWKLFLLFEPVRSMSVAEAERVGVGDTVNLEGRPVAVTLVGESRVYHIEGRAPEGVEVGDVARYFNADEGPRMLVVSWTGQEIEFFRGMDVPAQAVERAFGVQSAPVMPAMSSSRPSSLTPEYLAGDREPTVGGVGGMFRNIVVIAIVAVAGIFGYTKWNQSRQKAVPRRVFTQVAELGVGKTGSVLGREFTVTGRATIEVFRPAFRYDWHEYQLQSRDGSMVALIGGLNVGSNEWWLFETVVGPGLPDPKSAAALRVGDTVAVGTRNLRVEDLFLCREVHRQGKVPVGGDFGLLAKGDGVMVVMRWSEQALHCQMGQKVSETEVRAAFGVGAK